MRGGNQWHILARQSLLKGQPAEVSGPCKIMVVTDACEILIKPLHIYENLKFKATVWCGLCNYLFFYLPSAGPICSKRMSVVK
jgi:hypothetical protein